MKSKKEIKSMNQIQAESILGKNQPKWLLQQIIKALSKLPLLNTVEDNYRLQTAKTLLKSKF